MCQGYTFCQQSQRKLYSVSYKTVISCFANIPIHPSLWCDSTVEKQNRHKLKTQPSSFPSCREPWGILNCDPPAWESQQGNPPISLVRRSPWGQTRNRGRGTQSGPQNFLQPRGCLPLGCIASSKDAQFPKHIDVPVWGLHSLPGCDWTPLGCYFL